MDPVVVLFRADLRVDDHAPLVHAAEEAASVVPVVCFDPRHFGRKADGFEKTGRYRACFLLDSVRALRGTFKEMGADLLVRVGKPEVVVVDVCRRIGAKRVFLHAETTF
jgi:deoxyribodipyrimidine photolyase